MTLRKFHVADPAMAAAVVAAPPPVKHTSFSLKEGE